MSWDRARAFAHRLAREGIRAGDSVVFYAENGPEWIAAALGVLRAGAVVSPIDVQFGDEDLAHILRDSAARAVITTRRRASQIKNLARSKLILLDDEEIFAGGEESELPLVRPNDPAVLFYTSGTTGAPKGVPLTQRNIASQFDVIARLNLIGAGDRVLLPLPSHHVYPFVIGMLAPLYSACRSFSRSPYGPATFTRAARGEVTAIVGVPRLSTAPCTPGIKARSSRPAASLAMFFRRLARAERVAAKIVMACVPAKRCSLLLRKRFGENLRLLASWRFGCSIHVARGNSRSA